MAQITVQSVQSELCRCIGKKFGIKDTNLQRLHAKLRGRLPRGFDADLKYLYDAEERMKHPKRRGQVDIRRLETIRRNCLARLGSIDVERDRGRTRALWMAELASRLILFALLLMGMLLWLNII